MKDNQNSATEGKTEFLLLNYAQFNPHITKPLFAKMPIFRDNPHKNKVIFYGGLRGGAVCKKYQQN